ncbi:hypothetical protein BKA70DRAFT_119753 [Coprinopsis sp. MPI-PUGE-AT-0042]|nr:hypothetical protein BKA70DRAFT_119753 [Coprinopsis sp. MPI-PUGE-AT-0042]
MPSSATSSSTNMTGNADDRLPEELVQDSFHSYLKSSLTQAKVERLVDEELLSSAEGDLMITGPALCLYFAALRCTTNPPSVPLPRSKENSSSRQPTDLSFENCPPAFTSFLKVWAKNVPLIQNLAPEYQHDLARVICGLPALCQPPDPSINGIAADMRGVAIEISQRRSFQDRYADALQTALDAGTSSRPKRASFVPPPSYDAPPSGSAPTSSPKRPKDEKVAPPLPNRPAPLHLNAVPNGSPGKGAYFTPPHSSTSSTFSAPRTPTSPSILAPEAPAIEFIRETLYASLADQLERTPSLRLLLMTDPSRAYFGSVAFAILDVSTRAISPEGEVIGVLGKHLTIAECPPPLRPLFHELVGIGQAAKEMEDEDNEIAIKYVIDNKTPPPTRIERVKKMLECGIGAEREITTGRSSVEGKAVAFSNRINALALGLTRLKPFRDRQDHVFKILAGIGKS